MWVQNKTAGYKGVNVTNFTTSFHSGLALCALIHKFRPQLIDYDSLNEGDKLKNIQIAMDAAQKYFGLEQYITHINPPGIAGTLCEGLVYYDAIVLNARKGGIAINQTA